jgi:hypothetical protein
MGFFASSGILNRRGFFSAPIAASAPAFSPTDIADLALWLKADAGVNTSGSNVTSWEDQSGNGNDATTQSGSPVLQSNIINGLPAISFASSYMTAPSVISGANPRTMFVVYYTDNEDIISNTICGENALSGIPNSRYFCIQARNDFLNSSPYLACYADDLSGPAYVDNAWNVAMGDYDGTTARLYNNGGLQDSGPKELDTAGDIFAIGGLYDLAFESYGEFFRGKIAEIVVYNSTLSGTERTQLFEYFNQRYAIY